MTVGKWPKASRSCPCPSCGHERRCHVREDGRAGRCYWPDKSGLVGATVKEEEDSTGPFLLWFLDPPTQGQASTAQILPSRATSGQIDRVYSRLLELCPISPAAVAELSKSRGLEPEQIKQLRFGRLPRAADCTRILGQLEREFGADLLRDVPGFFVSGEGVLGYQARGPGLIIPHLDGDQLVALQIRPDKTRGSKYYWFSSGGKGGASAQAPYVVGDASGTHGLVVITEGAFKALAVAKKLNALAIGLPGVGSLEPALGLLTAVGAKEVILAFDADHAEQVEGRKNQVFASLQSAVARLRTQSLAVGLLLWNRSETYVAGEVPKGIDDAIGAGHELYELRGDEVDVYLKTVATALGQLPPEPKKDTDEKPTSNFRRLKARMEGIFSFFSDSGVAYLACKDGTAFDLSGKEADLELFRTLERAMGGEPPSPELRRQISESKTAEVRRKGPFHRVHRRLAHLNGRYYLDLCRPDGKVIEMTAAGWRITDSPPHLYWKRKPTQDTALPDPIPGGDVRLLGQVLNAKGSSLKFLIAFLVAILRPQFSFPLLVIEGRAGSAKSGAAKILKFMVDPDDDLAADLPKSKEDVAVACNAAHLVVFDNIDRIKPDMSDFLCQVATGSAIKKRALYTAGEEVALKVKNPVIISGIDGIVDRADLASRSALVTLEPIRDAERREEREVWAIAERIRPQVLGGILDAFVAGLANLDKTEKPKARNIDFARFMLSSENGLPWKRGEATEFLTTSRNELYEQALWKDRVALALIDFQMRRGSWTGTMAELLSSLSPTSAVGDDYWPTTPHKLTRRITQAAPLLEYKGISVTREGRSNRGPVFSITSLTRKEVASTASEVLDAAESLLF